VLKDLSSLDIMFGIGAQVITPTTGEVAPLAIVEVDEVTITCPRYVMCLVLCDTSLSATAWALTYNVMYVPRRSLAVVFESMPNDGPAAAAMVAEVIRANGDFGRVGGTAETAVT
jgi:hypothetical protein